MYYYIFCNKKIKTSNTVVNTTVFPQYVEMIPAQVEFYLANPNASIEEIKQCQIIPPYVIPLEELKSVSIEHISEYSLSIAREILPEYKVQNAIVCTGLNDHTNSIYPHDECLAILEKYNRIGKTCREMFYTFKSNLENCNTNEEVDLLVETTRNEYNTLLENEKELL